MVSRLLQTACQKVNGFSCTIHSPRRIQNKNKVTNPANREENWEEINNFCEIVNQELEGPSYAVRLLAHKVQSPIEREALFALSTIEACVKSCGKRFHQEIGKFRFLNEVIKVISPKYLGSKTTEKVKRRCIELMYCWHKGLPHEPKISDAYMMLKQQGIVKEDPVYMDKKCLEIPKHTLLSEEDKRAAFEDEEKSKLLAKLLKSKNPEDLQAANRLIKNMVKQDTERMEKVSRRINELETIKANLKLLGEMVAQYNPETTTQSEKEMMKELYESLEKLRPKLFRLASETDENDTDGMNAILRANDEVSGVMNSYKTIVEGVETNGQPESRKDDVECVDVGGSREGGNSLLDLTFDQASNQRHSDPPPAYSQQTPSLSSSILDDELLSLGLKTPGEEMSRPDAGNNSNLFSDLDDIFSASSTASQQQVQAGSAMLNSFPGGQHVSQPMGYQVAGQVGQAPAYSLPMAQTNRNAGPSYASISQPTTNSYGGSPLSQTTTHAMNQSPLSHQMAAAPVLSEPQKKAMLDLDCLGQSLMQQSLVDTTAKLPFNPAPKGPPPKVTLNQMSSTASQPLMPATHPPPVSAVSGSTATTLSSTYPSPMPAEVQPLTDLFVPLETIQPGSLPPVTAYDKNGLKIIIHIGKDRPRADVSVMVVSVMSTNTVPVRGFVFQAAVPKIMKVKLQPPSATDLPAYNPILPPTAITQVMLLANPQKEKIRVKYKVTCTINDKQVSEQGDIDTLAVQ